MFPEKRLLRVAQFAAIVFGVLLLGTIVPPVTRFLQTSTEGLLAYSLAMLTTLVTLVLALVLLNRE